MLGVRAMEVFWVLEVGDLEVMMEGRVKVVCNWALDGEEQNEQGCDRGE